MTRVNVFLTLVVLGCALGVVTAQHRARKLYNDIEREQARMRELEVEWGQLQLEAGTWAAHARVEKIARERLHMVTPTPDQIIAVEQGRGGSHEVRP
jgi:cell division protein FtsL